MKAKLLVSVTIISAISFGIGCDSVIIDSAPPADQPCENCEDLPAAPPAVTSVYPQVFYSGAEVKVSGSYLDRATLAVNGTPVTPTSQSAHEVHFVAPELPAGSYQLDIENAVGDALHEVTYQTVLSASIVSSGSSHTCAINTVGRVQCWGENFSGQLGDGSTTDALTPVTVSGLIAAVAVTAGGGHSCALYHDGAVSCWGDNIYAQAGWPVWVYGLGGLILKP